MARKTRTEIEKARIEAKKEIISKMVDVLRTPTGMMLGTLFVGKLLEIYFNKTGDKENSGVIAGMNSTLQSAILVAFTSDLITDVVRIITAKLGES